MSGVVQFVLIGGFLGAGKTTLMTQLGRRLVEGGRRVAVITNDQAADLVDSETARLEGLPVAQIAGGCFCCRFNDLLSACEQILEAVRPDVLLAEPVGSCADLAATVLQPIRQFYGDRFRLSPYSVLIDPERFEDVLDGPLQGSPLAWLFGKQLEEADLLVLNKLDRLGDERREALTSRLKQALPATPVVPLSALTGEGVDDWWRRVEAGGLVGQRLLDIDYDTYAEAEAGMGWLNATVELAAGRPWDAAALLRDLLTDLRHGASKVVAPIGHIKALVETDQGAVRGNVTSTSAPVELSGMLPGPVQAARLTLNARVEMAPEALSDMVARALRRVCNAYRVTPELERLQAFSPARPTPTHRLGNAA